MSSISIQIPKFVHGTEQLEEHIQKFTKDAEASFHEIIQSTLNATEKYAYLRELRGSIKEVRREHHEAYNASALVALRNEIKEESDELRVTYQTNSHWLTRTMQFGMHMTEMKPDPRKNPTIKLTLNDIDASLANIASLQRGIDQIRALQHFNKMVSTELEPVEMEIYSAQTSGGMEESLSSLRERRTALLDARRKISDFGEKHLNFDEKITLITQIQGWDRDATQGRELRTLLDKSGHDFASFLFKETITTSQLFDSLILLLKEVYYNHPNQSLIKIVQKWPQSTRDLDTATFNTTDLSLEMLLKLSEAPGFPENPFVIAVHEYLLNFLDLNGMERFQRLYELAKHKKIHSGEYYREVGKLVCLLRLYKLPHEHIFEQVSPPKRQVKKVKALPDVMNIMRSGTGGRGRKIEIMQLARSLRYQTAQVFVGLHSEAGNDTEMIQNLNAANVTHGDKLASFIGAEFSAEQSDRERVCVLENLMQLANLSSLIGNYYAAYMIMNALERTRMEFENCQKAWEEYKGKKSFETYKNLNTLFEVSGNWKNYRMHLDKLETKGMVCIQMLSIFGGELDKFVQVHKQNRDQYTQTFVESMTEEEFEVLCSHLYLDADGPKTLEEKRGALFNDVGMLIEALERVQTDEVKRSESKAAVQTYQDAQLENEAGIERIHRLVFSLAFALQFELVNKPPQNLSEDFLKSIEAQQVNQE